MLLRTLLHVSRMSDCLCVEKGGWVRGAICCSKWWSFWVVSSEAACLTSCTLGTELLMQVGLLALPSSLTPLLTPASPPVLADRKLHLHPSFSGCLVRWRKTPSLSFYCSSSSGAFFPLYFCTFLALVFTHQKHRESFVLIHCGAQPKSSPLWSGQDMPDLLLLQFLTHEDQVAFSSTGQDYVSPWCASVLQTRSAFTVSSPVEVKKPPGELTQ